jgi:hypothetical protein
VRFLQKNPKLTFEQACRCIDNYYDSALNISQRPAKYITTLLEYWSGPLNQYQKPLSQERHKWL